jgi:hypothetical protein
MKNANNANVTFWGSLIMSQTSPNIWGQVFFMAFAAFILYRVYKEDNEQSKTDLDNTGRGESGCTNGTCEQPCKPKQPRNRTKAAQVPSKE